MRVKAFIEFITSDNLVIMRQSFRYDTIDGIAIPNNFIKARVFCRVEKDTSFRNQNVTLSSRDLAETVLDFSSYSNLPDKDRQQAEVQDLYDILSNSRFDMNVKQIKNDYTINRKIRYFNSAHPEASGKAFIVKSNSLLDIKIPKNCVRFEVFDELNLKVMVNEKVEVLRSPELNKKTYVIGREVESLNTNPENNDTVFVNTKNGTLYFATPDEIVLDPDNIDENGIICI